MIMTVRSLSTKTISHTGITNFIVVKAQCETSGHHLIMSFAFNVSSDVLMLFFSVPLLLKSKLPWKQQVPLLCHTMSTCVDINLISSRKSIITGIFSLGIFVVSRFPCTGFS